MVTTLPGWKSWRGKEVARLLERILDNLEIGWGPEKYDEHCSPPRPALAAWYFQILLLRGAQANIHSTEGQRHVCKLTSSEGRETGCQNRDKHLLAKWPRGKGQDKVRLLLEGLYSILSYVSFCGSKPEP